VTLDAQATTRNTNPKVHKWLESVKKIRINDDAYRRAGDIASARNITISDLVEELVESVTGDRHPVTSDLDALFASLDKGRNTKPVGRLGRCELY
jgi:predicted DNA-binding ribbon-helix-helix protein